MIISMCLFIMLSSCDLKTDYIVNSSNLHKEYIIIRFSDRERDSFNVILLNNLEKVLLSKYDLHLSGLFTLYACKPM